ncbi:MAG: hypothetical protein JW718_07005 [Desulfovibrionaceae bacterium]|nr:hypothetical protein [Desulfovibrionaceae bacterium]
MTNYLSKVHDYPVDYNPNSPWSSDKLGRKALTPPLTNFIASLDQPFVLAINSGWGSGKTLFLQMWSDDLRFLQKRPCILFNAWKHDFADDPLMPFVDSINQFAEKIQKEDGNETKDIARQIAVKVGALLKIAPKHLLKFGAKYLAQKGLNFEEWNQGADDAITSSKNNKDFADCLGEIAYEAYGTYQAHKQGIEDFKFLLEKLAKHIKSRNDGFPFVIMIDELDRCRPDYAVALLERMKHLFNVPGVIFVLAIEDKQLHHTIKCLYGQEMNAESYLRRFIDLWYALPEPKMDAYIDYMLDYFKISERYNDNIYDFENFKKVLSEIIGKINLSLRDIAQIFTRLNGVIRAYSLDWINALLATFYITIYSFNFEKYKKMSKDINYFDKVKDILGNFNITPSSHIGTAIFKSCFAFMRGGKKELNNLVNESVNYLNKHKENTAASTKTQQAILELRKTVENSAPSHKKIIQCVEMAMAFEPAITRDKQETEIREE